MPENWTYFGEQFFLCQNKEKSSRQHLKLLARRESFNRSSSSVTIINDEEDFQVLQSNSFYIRLSTTDLFTHKAGRDLELI